MEKNETKDSGEKKPLKKVRAGRFQISIWNFPMLLSNGGKDSTAYIEKWVDVERACIQYSIKNKATGQWKNQSIWFPVDDLRNLAKVVDQLNEKDEDSSSPSSKDKKDELEGFARQSEDKAN